jgi:hypothetical protein
MLVLAMEFSRGARPSSSRRTTIGTDRRAAGAHSATGIAEEATLSLPQNGIVRSDGHTGPGNECRPDRTPLGGDETAHSSRRACVIAE